MIRLLIKGLVLVVLVEWLLACQPAEPTLKEDAQYMPISAGRYWVYEVQEENYSLSADPRLSTYYLKEMISDLPSSQTDKIYKLIRYKRGRLTGAWKIDSVWTVQQWPDHLIRTENATAFIKLVYPITSSTAWNPNRYNALPATTWHYEQLGKAYMAGTKNYMNTIQVVSRQNDSTALSLNRYMDVYAYQAGLIFSEKVMLAYCQSSPNCIGKGQIAYGYRRRQTLIETGAE